MPGDYVLRSRACQKTSDLKHDGKGVVRVPDGACSACRAMQTEQDFRRRVERVDQGKPVSKQTNNRHLKSVDQLLSLKVATAAQHRLAVKRSHNKIKTLKSGKEKLEDRLSRGDLAGVFGHLECLQRHAADYSGVLNFITDMTTNAAYKVNGDENAKRQRRHKWTESTKAIIGQLRLTKGSGAVNFLHDNIFTPALSTTKTFLKTKRVLFNMWDIRANIDTAFENYKNILTNRKLIDTGYRHKLELACDETGMINVRTCDAASDSVTQTCPCANCLDDAEACAAPATKKSTAAAILSRKASKSPR